MCVLRGFRSQLALWRLLTGGNFWCYPLLAGVPAGSLLLADLGYFAWPWFDDRTHRG